MGRPKQLEPWGTSTLLGHVLEKTRSFGVDEIWVVLGHDIESILENAELDDVSVVENPEWEEGIASSLRVALDALTRLSKCDSALVVIGDQPDISADVVSALLTSHAKEGRPVTIPKYRYTWGNPVLVDRSLWPRLMSLEGDEGAKRLWQAHPEWVNEVWFPAQPPRDVDTEADVVELRPRLP